MLNIEEIKARVEKATPGPWRTSGDIEHLVCTGENPDEYGGTPLIADCGKLYHADTKQHVKKMQDNADFIAHARTDIPALIAEVESCNDQHRCDVHNISAMQATIDQQAKNCEKLLSGDKLEIATLKKALKLMADRLELHLGACPLDVCETAIDCSHDANRCKSQISACWVKFFIQQAQEKEERHG